MDTDIRIACMVQMEDTASRQLIKNYTNVSSGSFKAFALPRCPSSVVSLMLRWRMTPIQNLCIACMVCAWGGSKSDGGMCACE